MTTAERPGPALQPEMGFFTDTSICIGCKACEVACKEWNRIPVDDMGLTGMSYDNTQGLGGSTWRHVAFVEQPLPGRTPGDGHGGHEHGHGHDEHGHGGHGSHGSGGHGGPGADLGHGGDGRVVAAGELGGGQTATTGDGGSRLRWLMASDVCKHCSRAGCLDVCPTGALFRTEFGSVVVQQDVCNGCGYCVSACPYGVIDQRPGDGRVFKCTLCYDRLGDGMEPACAKACPTRSIQFGPLEELRARARERVGELHRAGVGEARLYGEDTEDGVGGDHAFFLLLDEPEVYGLPPDPVVPTRDLPDMWRHAGLAALTLLAGVTAAFALGRGETRRAPRTAARRGAAQAVRRAARAGKRGMGR
ncbi:4Fe-4S dicluster domain-containing protein [Bailinhaonella thermotolerans]|uniref:4Fe-4S dicluster domain-containing protein n=1 Tax=Bailinhaonella thermotolerans TaxID=1070861 RepID=A0A3A4A3I8_9ACTN|nr:4Fe-4S dicluster domain-containing protein [Bailinhaonella thermotolerans]RJL23015.1 4Fe-4S dicluster domain-containing protein [Bailinhaonella thermotolerans]